MMRHAGKRSPGVYAALAALVVAWIAVAQPLPAAAHGYKFDTVAVGHIWAPPALRDATGVPVYGPLLNRGETKDSLVDASSPVAAQVRFRVMKDGKAQWRKTVALKPGRPLGLARWRVHLWLTGLKRPLKEGDRFDLTLTFAHAGTHTVQVFVEKAPNH
jgi:copper(I)-binding protein